MPQVKSQVKVLPKSNCVGIYAFKSFLTVKPTPPGHVSSEIVSVK